MTMRYLSTLGYRWESVQYMFQVEHPKKKWYIQLWTEIKNISCFLFITHPFCEFPVSQFSQGKTCSHCRVPVFITGIFLYFPVLPCRGLQCNCGKKCSSARKIKSRKHYKFSALRPRICKLFSQFFSSHWNNFFSQYVRTIMVTKYHFCLCLFLSFRFPCSKGQAVRAI